VLALVLNFALLGRAPVYTATLAVQLAFLGVAALGRIKAGRFRPAALCYYYVLVTASLAAGLWDWLRKGTSPTWEPARGRE
jgi:hypothetical protein